MMCFNLDIALDFVDSLCYGTGKDVTTDAITDSQDSLNRNDNGEPQLSGADGETVTPSSVTNEPTGSQSRHISLGK